MPTLAEVRAQYPQYSDMPDDKLASALHSKFYSDMPEADFHAKIRYEKPLDKYQQAAVEERDKLKAAGVDNGAGLARQAIQGITMGGADEVLAGLSTPLEMIKRGTFDPREGYNYAKARENLVVEGYRKEHPILSTGAEIAGGVVGGAGLAKSGLTLAKEGAGFLNRVGRGLLEGAGYGAANGFLEGDGAGDRLGKAGMGSLVGGAVGGGLPVVGGVLGTVGGGVASSIRARFNPQGVAESQLARALMDSGKTASEIERGVQQAHYEGQGGYTLADEMGNAGQRLLSTVTRAPGPGRQAGVEFLENRQAGQGRRLTSALADALQAPDTAKQRVATLEAARKADADVAYNTVRSDAGRVNVVDPINHIDRIIGTGPGQAVPHANDSIESALAGYRDRLARINPDDFEAVQRLRGEIADAADVAFRKGEGNKSRLIGGLKQKLDTAMEDASAGHLQANRDFRTASQNIDAVGEGTSAATRGRMEDTIPTFNAMRPDQQSGFRVGYADKNIADIQHAAPGANKSRLLSADSVAEELKAISTHNGPYRPGEIDPLTRHTNRENTMFETKRQATGGSGTHENGNDAAALAVDPTIFLSLAQGNFAHAGGQLLRGIGNGLTGYTPAVREELGKLLLSRGPDTQISGTVQKVIKSIEDRQKIARHLMNGVYSGTGSALHLNK